MLDVVILVHRLDGPAPSAAALEARMARIKARRGGFGLTQQDVEG